jgi:hypothetical protein
MNVQNYAMSPATSWCYVWHPISNKCYVWRPITNKLNPLNCWYVSLLHKKPVPNSWFSFPIPQKNVYSPSGWAPPPSHLTCCTPAKSNLYFDSSLETVFRERALYKLLTFHNPNHISIFRTLGRLSKESVQVQGSFWIFVTNSFFTVKSL